MKKVVVCPEILRSNLQRTLVIAVFQVGHWSYCILRLAALPLASRVFAPRRNLKIKKNSGGGAAFVENRQVFFSYTKLPNPIKKLRYRLLISVNGKWVLLSNTFVLLKKNTLYICFFLFNNLCCR